MYYIIAILAFIVVIIVAYKYGRNSGKKDMASYLESIYRPRGGNRC